MTRCLILGVGFQGQAIFVFLYMGCTLTPRRHLVNMTEPNRPYGAVMRPYVRLL